MRNSCFQPTVAMEARVCVSRVNMLTSRLTVEFATLTLDAEKRPKAKIYKPAEIDALLVKHDLAKKDEDAEMRAA